MVAERSVPDDALVPHLHQETQVDIVDFTVKEKSMVTCWQYILTNTYVTKVIEFYVDHCI